MSGGSAEMRRRIANQTFASANSSAPNSSGASPAAVKKLQDFKTAEEYKSALAQSQKEKFKGARQRKEVTSSRIVTMLTVILTGIAFLTRFWLINHPNQVVFDEVHFGKFASYYLQRKFFFDVHPPLGKLMLAAQAYISGYDGHYLFDKIGESYIDNQVPYVAIRSLPALYGTLLVPLVFLILIKTNHSIASSLLGAAMVLFDNALVTHSRLILLDSFLVFFDIFAVFTWVMFYRQRHDPYSVRWWVWLVMTGVALALATGVKMVGLFAVGLVGLCTLHDLWRIMDIRRRLSIEDVYLHFSSRVAGLIAVPFVVYLAFFAIHFKVLFKSGPQDTFMSPGFQATLEGSRLAAPSETVYYGSEITILHSKISSYLHSHVQKYPLRYDDGRVSSEGQQVTGYGHVDDNNKWLLIPVDGVMDEVDAEGNSHPRYWRNGDKFHLEHISTKKRLLTHDVASPLTATNTEFTCVDPGVRVNETIFILDTKDNADFVNSIDTEFRVKHMDTGVSMHMHKGKYGKWGFEQFEVNGSKNPKDANNWWIVDRHNGTRGVIQVRDGNEHASKRPGFFVKFVELQNVMLRENAGLVAAHPFQSSPFTWPIMTRGISFWVNEKDAQIYFVGNPLAWYVGWMSVWVLVGLILSDQLFLRRGIDIFTEPVRRRMLMTGGFFLVGYFLHYWPFFTMGRALFIHHYLPALVYTFFITTHVLDVATTSVPRMRPVIVTMAILLLAYVYYVFAPFTYGLSLTKEQVSARKWLSTWDFSYGLPE